MRFIDRHLERSALADAWASSRPELVVVHGRRRVGKSELLSRWAAGKPIVYFVAAQQLERDQLADLGRALRPLLMRSRGTGPVRLNLVDWDGALDAVAAAAAGRRVGLVLDEFPYLVDANPALPSLLQRWWDRSGSKSNIVLVLAGSEQSMMRRLVSSDGALYGRPTRRIHLHPFDYFHAARFAPRWPVEDRVRLYAVAGGIPDYLEEFDPARSLRAELLRVAYAPDGRLYREAPDLLRSEFTEPRTYETVLRAMANGATTPGEIASRAGLAGANRVNPYLERLIDLELVERRVPPTERAEARPRISQYVVADPYLRFYFALVDPWRSAIQAGQGTQVLDDLWGDAFDVHVSHVFEDIARQHLRRLAGAQLIDSVAQVGLWWFSGGDIDVAGTRGRHLVAAGSAKWTREFVKPADLANLRRDVGLVAPGDDPLLLLYARTGFDRNLAAELGVRLIRLRELFRPELEFEKPPRSHE